MGKVKITKEEALTKFQAAKDKKRECLKVLEKTMKETYKKRTGKEAESFFALWWTLLFLNPLIPKLLIM